MRRARSCLLAGAAAALLLGGCTSSHGSGEPTWVPSPQPTGGYEGPNQRAQPILPTPSLSGQGNGTPIPGGPSSGSKSRSKKDDLVVATHLTAPVGLTLLPDGTALVGERTTGRIVQVQPQPGRPVRTIRTLTGLATSGDGGLLDLALSPTYDEDNLIYAYITTPTDNRVVDFTLRGPVTPVLVGIPSGRTGNTGRLMFGTDGSLYVGTGDAGKPALAANPKSLAGKVLRLSDIGKPAPGNPSASSPVYTRGHHVVDGLCSVPGAGTVLEVEAGGGGASDEINALVKGGNYGWPTPTGSDQPAIGTPPAPYLGPGGCAVLGSVLWVTSLDGTALLSAPLHGSGAAMTVGKFTPVLKGRYGRLRTVVAAPDGALWLTTSNRDGHGKPVPADERVIRYPPNAAAGGGGGGKAV